jgi:hypothetical protein
LPLNYHLTGLQAYLIKQIIKFLWFWFNCRSVVCCAVFSFISWQLCIWQWNYHTIFNPKYFYCFQIFHSVSSRNLFALIPSSHLCSLAWLIRRPYKQGMGRKRQNCCEKWGIWKQNHCVEWSRFYFFAKSLIRYIWLFAPFLSMSELTLDVKVQNTNYNTSVASANASSTHPGQGAPRFLEYVVCYPCLPVHNIWSALLIYHFIPFQIKKKITYETKHFVSGCVP